LQYVSLLEKASLPARREAWPGPPIRAKEYDFAALAKVTDDFSEAAELGRGAFGIVYRAKLEGQDVAIKMMASPCDDTTLDSLAEDMARELRALEECDHENILAVLGFSATPGTNPCLVLPFIDGGNLGVALIKETFLSWQQRLMILLGVAKALEHVHARKYLHLDLKPDNILLRADNTPLLVDFGLANKSYYAARRVDGGIEAEESPEKGTPGYMDPGMISDGTTFWCDIYSFGQFHH
jgi:serine/threonine protein kinase